MDKSGDVGVRPDHIRAITPIEALNTLVPIACMRSSCPIPTSGWSIVSFEQRKTTYSEGNSVRRCTRRLRPFTSVLRCEAKSTNKTWLGSNWGGTTHRVKPEDGDHLMRMFIVVGLALQVGIASAAVTDYYVDQ